jgi:hypothetical protein
MAEQARTVGLAKGGWKSCGVNETPQDVVPTLASQDIDKNLARSSSRSRLA